MAETPQVPERRCEFREMPNAEPKQKTVGDVFVLHCEGLLDVALGDAAQVQFAEAADQYILKILKVEKSSQSEMEMLVTSYKPGQHANKTFVISDGTGRFQAKDMSWQVESVLGQLEKPEPFPAFGPFQQVYPLWIWLILAIVLLVPAGLTFRWVRKRKQKQKLIDASMLGLGPALSPYQDFSKEHRKLVRGFGDPNQGRTELLKEMNKMFRLYLVRVCLVPAFDWSDREVINDIRKNYRNIFEFAGADIRRSLEELSKAQGQNLGDRDYEQLLALLQKTVDKMDRQLQSRKRA